MDNQLELMSDGDGIAVFGEAAAVERFLSSAGVPSKELSLGKRLRSSAGIGASIVKSGADIGAQSGRWVKLTEESARAMNAGQLMTGSTAGVSRAVVTDNGKIKSLLEIVQTPGSMLANPAVLAGAAGIMAQLAMEQTMEEITEYLAIIDEKVDDVLRAQKDSALAEMIGVGLVMDDAMIRREHVGRVSEVTWSQVQHAPHVIARTQAFALRQLDALGDKLEKKKRKVADLATVSKAAEASVQEWLAVLARCFQLQDGMAVLELDRVLDSAPEDLDRHRIAVQTARHARRELIAATTLRLVRRVDEAAGLANGKVLLHPVASGAVVRSSNVIGDDVVEFHDRLGIEQGRQALEAKRWVEAAVEARDTVVQSANVGIAATSRLGGEAISGAKTVASNVSAATGRLGGEALTNAKSVASSVSANLKGRLPQRRNNRDTETRRD